MTVSNKWVVNIYSAMNILKQINSDKTNDDACRIALLSNAFVIMNTSLKKHARTMGQCDITVANI